MDELTHVDIYTDGSCKGNPGPGGWGAVLVYNGIEKEINGGSYKTTNNRMEIMAVIEALKCLRKKCDVTVISDSKYVVSAFNEDWIGSWKEKNWVKSNKKPVLNVELWKELDELCDRQVIRFEWTKGHSGHKYNERCDSMAQSRADEYSAGENK